MKLLAIDTSTEIASIAVLVGNDINSAEQGSQKTHAQLLLPMIDRLMVDSGITVNQLDGIIFGCGPGSFTGLRIACSTAKGIAYGHDLGLIPVSSLAAIAWSVRELNNDFSLPVLALLDARMQEMYWGFFPADCLMAEEKVNAVKDIQLDAPESIVLAGVGIENYWDDFPEQLKSRSNNHRLSMYPKACAMIRLALHAQLKPVSVAQAQPVYVRNQVTQGASRG